MQRSSRYIVARDRNVVRVDFAGREPEPPAPRFPGAAALRQCHGEEPSEGRIGWRAA